MPNTSILDLFYGFEAQILPSSENNVLFPDVLGLNAQVLAASRWKDSSLVELVDTAQQDCTERSSEF